MSFCPGAFHKVASKTETQREAEPEKTSEESQRQWVRQGEKMQIKEEILGTWRARPEESPEEEKMEGNTLIHSFSTYSIIYRSIAKPFYLLGTEQRARV
jgi:hypothetical protein